MVRILVSTAVRESISAGARYGATNSDALLRMISERDRIITAPPAPVEGLCLAGVGYQEWNLEDETECE